LDRLPVPGSLKQRLLVQGPIMQRRWIKVCPIGPNQRVHLRINAAGRGKPRPYNRKLPITRVRAYLIAGSRTNKRRIFLLSLHSQIETYFREIKLDSKLS
jgi:hypothetical protein